MTVLDGGFSQANITPLELGEILHSNTVLIPIIWMIKIIVAATATIMVYLDCMKLLLLTFEQLEEHFYEAL